MAKSLRSKWKRKMKANKRVRYGEKELAVLHKIVANCDAAVKEHEDAEAEADTDMTDKSEVAESRSRFATTMTMSNSSSSRSDSKSALRSRSRSISRKAESNFSRIAEIRPKRLSRKPDCGSGSDEDEMDVDKAVRVFNKKTMIDQFGNYPAWMNSRKMNAMRTKARNKRKTKRLKAVKRGVTYKR